MVEQITDRMCVVLCNVCGVPAGVLHVEETGVTRPTRRSRHKPRYSDEIPEVVASLIRGGWLSSPQAEFVYCPDCFREKRKTLRYGRP